MYFSNCLSPDATSSPSVFYYKGVLVLLSCRWDFCLYKGSVIEHLDGHTDIVHKLLYDDWLPWFDPYLQFFKKLFVLF